MQADYRSTPVKKRKKSKHKKRIRAFVAVLLILAILAGMYLMLVYSQIPFIKNLRDIWIQTAWSTMSHRWLATAFFPQSVIDECIGRRTEIKEEQIGVVSTDPPDLEDVWEIPTPTQPDGEPMSGEDLAREIFYTYFWELDRNSAEAYFAEHPEVLANGYENIRINEAGLDKEGTTISTKMGEQVLAIDAKNKVLMLRIWIKGTYTTSRGVLAVAKDPAQLHLYPSSGLATGGYGQHVGSIAENNNGLIAITGSGFIDEEGNGNGGAIAGYCICDGQPFGDHTFGWGVKRLELKESNWLYINDAPNAVGDDVTDTMEFEPAMVVNGERMDIGQFYETNPRACLGQSRRGEVLMLVIEGRFVDSPGCSVAPCADKLIEHDCLTAMNLDGGTSAIMWYDGEVVTRCSNTRTPEGRYLPNAWVYTRVD